MPPRSPTRSAAVPALARAGVAGLAELLALALPVDCGGCGASDAALCAACRAALEVPARRVVAGALPEGLPAWAGPAYAGRVAHTVVAWKDRGRHDLGPPLAAVLADVLGAALSGCGGGRVLVVPVPTSPAGRRRRGADLVAELARRAVRRHRRGPADPRVNRALRVRRAVRDQAGLRAAQRSANVAGAFALRRRAARRLAGRRVVVVDDVLTTGSTAAEAVRVLTSAGARVVGVAAVAATPLRRARTGGIGTRPLVADRSKD